MTEHAAARLPALYFSTWGPGFYAQQWVAEHNAWMCSMLAFVEANLDLERDRAALPIFERLTASDYPFMHADPTQRAYAEESFSRLYRELMASLPLSRSEVLSVVPVDPFQHYFSYVSTEPREVLLEVSFLGAGDPGEGPGRTPSGVRTVTLEPEHVVKAGLHIYHQRFLLYPDTSYRVRVVGRGLDKVFRTPARGLPVVINAELQTCHPYNEARLYERLGGIWGPLLEVPEVPAHVRPSRGLYRRRELEARYPAPLATGVFKYNKEAFGLLRFGAGSRLRPVVVLDDQLALEQASVHMGLQDTDGMEIPVSNRLEDLARFELGAVVLTCAVNFESEIAFVRALLHRAAEQGLPVLSLYGDPLALALPGDRERLAESGQCYQIMVPAADAEALERAPDHVDPRKCLGVFGTDSVQGKFTTQVYLREALARHARVRHLATEPTGILTGADLGFSRVEGMVGPGSSNRIARIRRALLAELQQDADVVITGGQNALTYEPPGSDRTRNASTGIFQSVRPGWIILTVAMDTPLPLLQDTLAYLDRLAAENGHASEVIALAMLGGRKLKGSRWTETYFVAAPTTMALRARERIAAATGIPVFFVPEETEALARAVLGRL